MEKAYSFSEDLMDPLLFQFGAMLGAITLIGYAVMSLMTGAAYANGATIREALKPSLQSFRQSSSKSRSDLADATLVAGVVFAVMSVLVDNAFTGAILAVGLMWARTTVQKMTASEHPLMSIGTQFSADMAIGILGPIALAHVLLGNWMLAAAHGAVCVALSWPTGGPGRRESEWKPAWVQA